MILFKKHSLLFGLFLGLAIQVEQEALAQGGPAPVLLVIDSTNPVPYQHFLSEILVTEGLHAYETSELSNVTGVLLASYGVVILPSLSVTSQQADLFRGYVDEDGGILIGLKPDPQLAPTFGVTSLGATLTEDRHGVDGWKRSGVADAEVSWHRGCVFDPYRRCHPGDAVPGCGDVHEPPRGHGPTVWRRASDSVCLRPG